MAPDGRAKTRSWEIWLKIHFNHCLIGSCVRLYILILYYITAQYNVMVNSEELIGTVEYLTLIGKVSYKPMSL